MVLPAVTAKVPPINSMTSFGVRDTSVKSLTRGRMPTQLGKGTLTDGEVSLLQLERVAREYDQETSALTFIKEAFQPPVRPQPSRLAKIAAKCLGEDGSLGYWELLAVAKQWDAEGASYPLDFVRAISCEVKGHRRNRVAVEALDE